MTTIVTRAGKGSRLTYDEGDANFNNLNDDKLEPINNLSDLTSVSSARLNLGIGSIATQNADNFTITGGFVLSQSVNDLSTSINLTKMI